MTTSLASEFGKATKNDYLVPECIAVVCIILFYRHVATKRSKCPYANHVPPYLVVDHSSKLWPNGWRLAWRSSGLRSHCDGDLGPQNGESVSRFQFLLPPQAEPKPMNVGCELFLNTKNTTTFNSSNDLTGKRKSESLKFVGFSSELYQNNWTNEALFWNMGSLS